MNKFCVCDEFEASLNVTEMNIVMVDLPCMRVRYNTIDQPIPGHKCKTNGRFTLYEGPIQHY